MINSKINNFIFKSLFISFLFIVISFRTILAQPIKNFSNFTVFKTENEGFKFYSQVNSISQYSRSSINDINFSISIKRIGCDDSLDENTRCGIVENNSDVGDTVYDIFQFNNKDYLFKAYLKYRPPTGRQAAGYVRYPAKDIYVSSREFLIGPRDKSDYGDYKVYRRAFCDLENYLSNECFNRFGSSFNASSSEKILYDLSFSNPFRNNPSLREGNISIYAQAFKVFDKPTYSFSKLFAESPKIFSNSNQIVTNDVFRQLLIASFNNSEYLELIVDHYLTIKPDQDEATIDLYGSDPSDLAGANCSSFPYFPCAKIIDVFNFPVNNKNDEGKFFRDFLNNYFNENFVQKVNFEIYGRSGSWEVNLCYDNFLKKIFGSASRGNVDYLSNGRIRLTVDAHSGQGEVKIYLRRKILTNTTCANLGYRELLNYSW